MRAWLPLTAFALLAAGCLGANAPSEPAGVEDGKTRTDLADLRDLLYAFEGEVSAATPATPFEEDFAFEVPQGAVGVKTTLTWAGDASSLRVSLLDPRGESKGQGFPEKAGQASVATVDPPASGTWTARVTSTRALDQPFEVAVAVALLDPGNNTLRDSLEMNAATFAEVNLIMEEGATFNWSFVSSAGQPLNWNIHTHENGETRYLAQGSDAAYEDTFTAEKRHIYSILWENAGPATTLTYNVEGAFRVHSHSQ